MLFAGQTRNKDRSISRAAVRIDVSNGTSRPTLALRTLLKNPGFTGAAALTLALAIGANAAMFSVVNDVLLKPFSFSRPDRVVVVWERCLNQGLPRMVVSPPNFADWRVQNHVFETMAAYRPQDFTLTNSNGPEQIHGLRISANMFAMLGVRPVRGRDFH